MPLKKGTSRKTMGKNFHELKKKHSEMPNKQRIAIVMTEAGKSKKGKKK